jgi:hypothetical protein
LALSCSLQQQAAKKKNKFGPFKRPKLHQPVLSIILQALTTHLELDFKRPTLTLKDAPNPIS